MPRVRSQPRAYLSGSRSLLTLFKRVVTGLILLISMPAQVVPPSRRMAARDPVTVFFKAVPTGDRVVTSGEEAYASASADAGFPASAVSSWQWDGETLRATAGRLGLSPLYYYCGRDSFLISPVLPALLEHGA